ncbi:MAG: type II secretion system major pseudopilin GspG [Campylobacterales bacterium]
MKRVKRGGFSLIELMVVIVILGLLAAIVVPNLVGKSDDAKVKLTTVQMKQLEEALNMFRLDNGRYPTTEEGLEILIEKPEDLDLPNYARGGYLGGKSVPKDPWANEYLYFKDGSGFEIISLGADGEEGGEEIDADIKYSDSK